MILNRGLFSEGQEDAAVVRKLEDRGLFLHTLYTTTLLPPTTLKSFIQLKVQTKELSVCHTMLPASHSSLCM